MSNNHKYKIELIPRQYSVILLDTEVSDTNYVASCQLFCYGDRGFIYTINGKDFYKILLMENGADLLFTEANLVSLEGYVQPSHYRLLQRELQKASYQIHKIHDGLMAGKKMFWISVTRKKAT